jgi:hypothetical protein
LRVSFAAFSAIAYPTPTPDSTIMMRRKPGVFFSKGMAALTMGLQRPSSIAHVFPMRDRPQMMKPDASASATDVIEF